MTVDPRPLVVLLASTIGRPGPARARGAGGQGISTITEEAVVAAAREADGILIPRWTALHGHSDGGLPPPSGGRPARGRPGHRRRPAATRHGLRVVHAPAPTSRPSPSTPSCSCWPA